jgi:hypothetical protein
MVRLRCLGQPAGDRMTAYAYAPFEALADYIERLDRHLDADVGPAYLHNPLAQDWARIGKTIEEIGEVISNFIGITGQNPRKGVYSNMDEVLKELCDVSLTGLYAIQHFTKDKDRTLRLVLERSHHHCERVGV